MFTIPDSPTKHVEHPVDPEAQTLKGSTKMASERLLNDGVYRPQGATDSRDNLVTEARYRQKQQLDFTPIEGYDKPRGHDIAGTAARFEGQQLWRDPRYIRDMKNGALGCAVSESRVLREAGYGYADAESAGQLYNQLKAHGWKAVSADQARPNDVMFAYVNGTNWKVGGGNSHVGTVGDNGGIWNNSSRQGATWANEPRDVAFGAYNRYLVLRPPGN